MEGPPPEPAAARIILRDDLCLRREVEVDGVFVELERVRACSVRCDCWCARVRARRREERCRALSSAEGGSPKMKNFMKKKIRRAMESWPSRKPCVKDRLEKLVGSS